MQLCDKYAPFTLNKVVGNNTALSELAKFGSDIHSGKKVKPLLIYGHPGCGKTSAAHAFAYANGFEILEFNSSDYRDSESLTKRALPASKSRGLFNKTTLFIFDEIDELSSKFDSGAEKIITQLIRESRQPVIFIATDYWDRRISFLRELVNKVEFKKPSKDDVLKLLKEVAEKEKGKVEEKVLEEIAARSNGDIRGALNDLELMIDAKPELIEYLGIRDRKMEIFGVLDKIFLRPNFDTARFAVINSDLDTDMLINWVEENIPTRYPASSEINEAYTHLSKASMFNEKARRVNYYGYLRYAQVLLSSGVSSANNGRVSMLKSYSFPSTIRYMSKTKKERSTMSDIAAKLTPMLHTNKKDIIRNYLPLLHIMLEKSIKEYGEEKTLDFVERNMGLEKSDVTAVLGIYTHS